MIVHPTKLLLAGLSTMGLLACGSHSASDDRTSAGGQTGADALSADNDAIVPPQEYYDALYQRTIDNMGKTAGLNLAGAKQVLYVNFNGVTISKGYGAGQSFIPCQNNVTIPPSGISAADQASIMTKAAAYYTAANAALVLTSTKPTSGDYTTLHVGGTYSTLGCIGAGVLGVAPLDKGNRNANDIGFVFSGLDHSVKTMAITIAHEAGHTFGLNHVAEQPDIMYPAVNGNITGFLVSTANFVQQNEPQILSSELGAGAATVVNGTTVVTAPAPAAPASPAPAPAAPAPSTPVATTPIAGLPNLPNIGDLSGLLAGLANAGNNPDLIKQIQDAAAKIFGLSAANGPADLIKGLQDGIQAILAGSSGGDQAQLLDLLKKAASDEYAKLLAGLK